MIMIGAWAGGCEQVIACACASAARDGAVPCVSMLSNVDEGDGQSIVI